MKSIKVTILGCGYSGMISAIALANQGVSITIIENASIDNEAFFDDPRTLAITATSKRFMQQIAIWDKIKGLCAPINDIYVVDNKSPQMIHFETQDITDDEFMGYMCLNAEFKKSLVEIVKNNPNIIVIDKACYGKIENSNSACAIEVIENRDGGGDNNAEVKLGSSVAGNTRKIKSDIIIACDGKRSKAKRDFFSTKIEKDYYQKAFTFTVTHEKPHEGTAVEHFINSGPFASLPLRWPNRSSVVLSVENKKAEAIENLSTREFSHFVQDKFGEFLGKVTIDVIREDKEAASKIVKDYFRSFPLTANITNSYVNKRVLLIADSAHTIHPLAGQGLNQGIKDIKALYELLNKENIQKLSFPARDLQASGAKEAEQVASSGQDGKDYLSSLLKQYERSRKTDNHHMFEITDTINAVFSNNSQLMEKARNVSFDMIEKFPPFKRALVKYAMGRRVDNKTK